MTRTPIRALPSVGLAIALGALGSSSLQAAPAEPWLTPAATHTATSPAGHHALAHATLDRPIVDQACFRDCMKPARKALRRCVDRNCPFPPGEDLETCKNDHCFDELEEFIAKSEECEDECDIICSSSAP